MKRRRKEAVLTRILQKDAKKVCSSKKMDEVWKAIGRNLDERQTEHENRPSPRSMRPAVRTGKRILVICACFVVFVSLVAGIFHILSLIDQGTEIVIIIDKATPLAEASNTSRCVISLKTLIITVCLGIVLAVLIYLSAVRIRRKYVMRRVVRKLIQSAREQGTRENTVDIQGN